MKKVIIAMSVCLLMFTSQLSANSSWLTSYEDAIKVSKALNKPILIDFWADWCAPCKKMDFDVWNKEEVNELMNNFVSVKIDIDSNKSLAMKYGVKGIPNVLILDSWGNVLHSSVGYKDKKQISKLLKSFSVDFTGVNQAMRILEKEVDNVYSNIRVGIKFQNASIDIEGDAKKACLKRSDFYLKRSLKLAGKEDKSLEEKIKLLRLLNKAYAKRYKKTLKLLDKEFKSVESSNNSLFYFAKFYCYNYLELNDKSAEFYDKLQKENNNANYLSKANEILEKS